MKKTSIFLAIVFAVCTLFAGATSAQAHGKKKKKAALSADSYESGNPPPGGDMNYYQSWTACTNLLVFRDQTISSLRADSQKKQANILNLTIQLSNASDSITILNEQNKKLKDQIAGLAKQTQSQPGFVATTPEISELVLDSAAIALVKNMELGLKFFQMSPEELASRYSGLSLNWQRSPGERYLFSGKSIKDISTVALQSEMKKWMMYLYDKSTGSDRLRLSKLFLNITGDTYFQRKY